MTKNIVVKKDNALINAAYTLTLAEQRLILLAVANATGQPDTLRGMSVNAKDYADRFQVTRQAAYMALAEATRQLFERRFSYQQINQRGNIEQVVSRWVQRVKYVEAEALVNLQFADDVIPLLCDLKDKFTYYELDQIGNLTSVHAIRLYELLISWRSTGKTPVYELADFRQRLGIEPKEYLRMTDFKRWVLDAAVKQINKHTDIFVDYEQHKQGRTITGFSFTFLAKKNQISNVVDIQTGTKRSKPKRHVITKAEAEKMARPGESHSELYQRLSREYVISD